MVENGHSKQEDSENKEETGTCSGQRFLFLLLSSNNEVINRTLDRGGNEEELEPSADASTVESVRSSSLSGFFFFFSSLFLFVASLRERLVELLVVYASTFVERHQKKMRASGTRTRPAMHF